MFQLKFANKKKLFIKRLLLHARCVLVMLRRLMSFLFAFVQSTIRVEDFQDAEPDVLGHSTPAIIGRFYDQGIRYNFALRALCKKKGFHVEVIIFLEGGKVT